MNCGLYKHYKGSFYQVLGVSEHTETNELCVMFVSLDPTLPGCRLRHRPLHQFIDYVDIPDGTTTKRVPRYEFIGIEPALPENQIESS